MQTFDGALYKLYKAGRISYEEALRNADSQNNLRLRIDLEEKDVENSAEVNGLRLEDNDDDNKGYRAISLS
jgi:twitching motility protein PilU